MPAIDRRLVQNFDWTLLGLVFVLSAMGFVNLFSATYTEGAPWSEEMRRQLLSFGIGIVVAVVAAGIDYRHYDRFAFPIYLGAAALLLVTLVVAPVTRGSQSWLFGGRVQPAEFAKLGLVLAMARYFHRNPPGETRRLRDLAWPVALIGLPVGLIVAQRDMGVALLTLLIGSTYLALVRIPWRAWAALAALGWPRWQHSGRSGSRRTRRSAFSPSSIRGAIRWRRAIR